MHFEVACRKSGNCFLDASANTDCKSTASWVVFLQRLDCFADIEFGHQRESLSLLNQKPTDFAITMD